MRWYLVVVSCSLMAGTLTGCPKRDTGEIDVDQIQGQVDAVDGHLKSMRVALKKKDLDEAEDQFEDAVEIIEGLQLGESIVVSDTDPLQGAETVLLVN